MINKNREFIVNSAREAFELSLRASEKVTDEINKIVIWLVGFGTGSIALLVSSGDKLKGYSATVINCITLLLLLTVLFGIVGRILSALNDYFSLRWHSKLNSQLRHLLYPLRPRLLTNTESAAIMEIYFREDFEYSEQAIQLLREKHPPSAADRDQLYRLAYMTYGLLVSEESKAIQQDVEKAVYKAMEKKQPAPKKSKVIIRTITLIQVTSIASAIFYFFTAAFFCAAIIIFVLRSLQQ